MCIQRFFLPREQPHINSGLDCDGSVTVKLDFFPYPLRIFGSSDSFCYETGCRTGAMAKIIGPWVNLAEQEVCLPPGILKNRNPLIVPQPRQCGRGYSHGHEDYGASDAPHLHAVTILFRRVNFTKLWRRSRRRKRRQSEPKLQRIFDAKCECDSRKTALSSLLSMRGS